MSAPSDRDNPPLGRTRIFDTSFVIMLGLTGVASVGVAWSEGPMRVVEITLNYLGFLVVLTPKILCGFFIVAAVPLLMPRETLAKWIGQDSGARGLLVASVAGALVPGGPMMIFPLAVSFRAAGATSATIIAFITAWSLYGINRTVVWEMSFMPVDLVVLRVAICLPLPILVGLMAQRVLR
jgi:uncharacterized membrane protein YraQ (UPF0718 family)